jgi:cytoskeletal protein CcmA (bactofilin family)
VRKKLIFLFVLIALLLLVTPAYAITFKTREERVTISKGETIKGDLYAASGTVEIDGDIKGDLIVAGGFVVINGVVEGDLMSAGGVVVLNGEVKEDALVLGGNVTINGKIGGDLKAGGGSVTLSKRSEVSEDALFGCGNLIANGSVGESFVAGAGSVLLNGPVKGNVRISSEDITLGSEANISGNLIYYSSKKIKLEPGAVVKGKVIQKIPPKEEKPRRPTPPLMGLLFYLFFSVISFLAALLTAFVLIAMFPKVATGALELLDGELWKSLGIGFLALILLPPVALILIFTLVGLPLGMIGFATYFIYIYLSQIVFGIFLGEKILKGITKKEAVSFYGAAFVGLIILAFLGLIPFLGWLVKFVVILFGLGALVLLTFKKGGKVEELAVSSPAAVEGEKQ